MEGELELRNTLYRHFYTIEDKIKLEELRCSIVDNEDLLLHYRKLEKYFREQEEKRSKYELVNTKTLESYNSEFLYNKDCGELNNYFDDVDFSDCIDFDNCSIHEDLRCDYCKIQHLIEYSKDNNNCIKVIKK